MRVLHLIDTLRPGGAERLAVELANQTVALGGGAAVCATRQGGSWIDLLDDGVQRLELGRRRRFDLPAMRRIGSFAKECRAELIHSHGRSSTALAGFARAAGVELPPILFHEHWGGAPPSWLFRLLSGRSFAGCVAASLDRISGMPLKRCHAQPGAVDFLRFDNRRADIELRAAARNRLGLASDALIGIAVGGLRAEKGLDVLLQALSELALPPRFLLLIVGGERDEPYARGCRSLTMRVGLGERVRFVGEQDSVEPWIVSSDLGLHAARVESGPLVLAELLAAGLPVVCTRVGEMARQAERAGIEGFVPPDAPEQFGAELQRLLDASAAEREKRGEQGRRRARELFDLRAQMPRWFEIYERTVRG